MRTTSLLSVLLIACIVLFSGCPTVDPPDPNLDSGNINKTINAYSGYPLYLRASKSQPFSGWKWYRNNGLDPSQDTIVYEISNFNINYAGRYTNAIDDTAGVVRIVDTFDIKLQRTAKDTLDTEYNYNEFVVKLVPGLSFAQKDALRKAFGATVLDSCLCNIELWLLDSLKIDVETQNKEITSSVEVEGSDPNYLVKHDTELLTLNGNATIPKIQNQSKKIRVAIIDTGIDTDHSEFVGKIWRNSKEFGQSPGVDEDGNCLIDDIVGYDFAEDDNNPKEKALWHGTHVAGIVNRFSQGHAEIMNLKAFGHQPIGTLFSVICATEYAVDKQAKIINYSFGWSQTPSTLLIETMERAGQNCGVLFVCSSGNSGRSNISTYHFPSGYNTRYPYFEQEKLFNVIEVTSSCDEKLTSPKRGEKRESCNKDTPRINGNIKLADYANWSNTIFVVEGNLPSAVPDNKYAYKKGTSMSAAVVTGILTNYIAKGNSLDWDDVYRCLNGNAYRVPSSSLINQVHWGGLGNQNFINPSSICQNVGVACPPTTVSSRSGQTIQNDVNIE